MATLQDFRNERLRKLEELRRLGVNPYPAKTERTNKNIEVKEKFSELDGKTVSVVGRIKNIRKMGKIGFIVIKDETDSLQLFLSESELGVADPANSEISFSELNLLDSGDFVEGTGEVIKTKTGEISVRLKKLRILTKALRPMPLAHEEFSDVESRYRQRHIDFNVNDGVKEDILLRSRVTEIIRRFLIEKDFVEVETPVLQPIYGGASARPFVTYHHKLEADLFLRVSPELYLKRAIVGGFERVFEFARNFRNEGIDRSHNPEFTMLEFYWSYADYNDLMDITTEMIHVVLKELFGKLSFEYQGHILDFSEIKKYTFREIILEKTGLDIDSVTREDLIEEIKKRKIEVDLKAPMKDLLDEFYKETCRKDIIQPIYLIDYPMEMIPLAKKKHSDPRYIESLQLVSCGFELLKAYSELNDPIDQLDRLTEDQKALDDGTSEEAMKVDIDFVSALEIGMPPTAGWGMGIDRFVSFLANKPAIKDVIMFPTLKAEEVDDATRKMYPAVNFGGQKKDAPGSKEKTRDQDFSSRIVTVVNKDLEPWQVANAVAHMDAIIGNELPKDKLTSGDVFIGADGVKIPRNSQYPIIIMRADEKVLHKIYAKVAEDKLLHHVFIKEMQETTNDAEIVNALADQPVSETTFYGVSFFASHEKADELTKGLQLWRG